MPSLSSTWISSKSSPAYRCGRLDGGDLAQVAGTFGAPDDVADVEGGRDAVVAELERVREDDDRDQVPLGRGLADVGLGDDGLAGDLAGARGERERGCDQGAVVHAAHPGREPD
jgi:hypothetical protein